VRELILETERLLGRLRAGFDIAEETMERWERRVEVRRSPIRDSECAGTQDYDRQGARPRRYHTSDGWSVWAGRNNRENDIVTHRLAAQNDLWFHAHGYAGSHVILRREGRKEEPSVRTVEEAAAVAAYWSKGRSANKVPVVYTLAKYVSKPRGGAAGLAVMKREKTLMVRPALLAEEQAE
jgi:predicted ribosome quality control (RQC) complex YloA/Tae2 family protein